MMLSMMRFVRSLSRQFSTTNNISFDVIKKSFDSKARVGILNTPHGVIDTPNFIFCATKAAMKSTSPEQLRDTKAQVMLSNTYHLMLAPGAEIIENMGGLQKFTGWNGPMLTDSGGYQIFSMGYGSVSKEIKGNRAIKTDSSDPLETTVLKINEQGATFRSYIDGTVHDLTPEKSIAIQRQLGADLIVVLDECTPFNIEKKYTEDSMHRSHRWAIRSLNEFNRLEKNLKYRGKQALYGIVQGGVFKDLRDVSTAFINGADFFGTAIGGSLGSTRREMHDIVAYTRARLRDDRPVHLLGIGGVRDIFHGVRQGIDTFDCVHPSRIARNGCCLVRADFWTEELIAKPPSIMDVKRIASRWTKLSSLDMQKRVAFVNSMTLKDKKVLCTVLRADAVKSKAKRIESLAVVKDLGTEAGRVKSESYAQYSMRQLSKAVLNLRDLEHDRVEVVHKTTDEPYTNETLVKYTYALRVVHGDAPQEKINTDDVDGDVDNYSNIDAVKETVHSSGKQMHTRKVREHITLKRAEFRTDPRPIDSTCGCYTCRNFSRAYLHHLFAVKENLGGTLATIHNAYFMNRLMTDIRQGISENNLDSVEKVYVHHDLVMEDLDKRLQTDEEFDV